MSEIDKVLTRLELVKEGNNGWRAKCPVHQGDESKSRTLAIRESQDGSVWLKCYAGCLNDSIVESIGLSFSDLFPDSGYIQSFKGGNHRHRKNYRLIVEHAKPATSLVLVYAGAIVDKWTQIAAILDLNERDRHIFLGACQDLQEVLDG